MFATPFSVEIKTLPADFQMECIPLVLDTQLNEKFDHVSLPVFYKPYLTREKCSFYFRTKRCKSRTQTVRTRKKNKNNTTKHIKIQGQY